MKYLRHLIKFLFNIINTRLPVHTRISTISIYLVFRLKGSLVFTFVCPRLLPLFSRSSNHFLYFPATDYVFFTFCFPPFYSRTSTNMHSLLNQCPIHFFVLLVVVPSIFLSPPALFRHDCTESAVFLVLPLSHHFV